MEASQDGTPVVSVTAVEGNEINGEERSTRTWETRRHIGQTVQLYEAGNIDEEAMSVSPSNSQKVKAFTRLSMSPTRLRGL